MRVITGIARGRKLKEPSDMDIRPTTDMVKEAIFSIIQFDIEGRRALDLFAGTGQLGIEALSRGAESAVFVDCGKLAVMLIKDNLAHCELKGQVVQGDSINYLERCGKFDLVFLDPPYDTELLNKALERIYKFDILSEGGIIVCESRTEKDIPEPAAPYVIRKSYRYGKVKITIIERQAR